MGIAGSMLEATSMAVITGWIFLQLDGSLSGIRSREGALYTASSLRKRFSKLFTSFPRPLFKSRNTLNNHQIILPSFVLPETACHATLCLQMGVLTLRFTRGLSYSIIRVLPSDN